MPLSTLLYRCPICGRDPVESWSDQVFCPSCKTRFEAAPPTGESRIRVVREGRILDVQAVLLNRRISALGGAGTRARDADGILRASAAVLARFVAREEPVRFRDRLLGFMERLDAYLEGELRLDGDHLELGPAVEGAGSTGRGSRTPIPPGSRRATPIAELHRWPVEAIDSLQTSSSAVQISVAGAGVVLFRFPHDSVRRWDDLIRRSLREQWRARGWGEITEFQPRVRSL